MGRSLPFCQSQLPAEVEGLIRQKSAEIVFVLQGDSGTSCRRNHSVRLQDLLKRVLSSFESSGTSSSMQ